MSEVYNIAALLGGKWPHRPSVKTMMRGDAIQEFEATYGPALAAYAAYQDVRDGARQNSRMNLRIARDKQKERFERAKEHEAERLRKELKLLYGNQRAIIRDYHSAMAHYPAKEAWARNQAEVEAALHEIAKAQAALARRRARRQRKLDAIAVPAFAIGEHGYALRARKK